MLFLSGEIVVYLFIYYQYYYFSERETKESEGLPGTDLLPAHLQQQELEQDAAS